MSATVRRLNIPALFTRMSMRPNRLVAERTISPHARKSPTSPAVMHDRRSPISFATAWSASLSVRPFTATFAPAPPSMTAMARPIPLEAPVTIATESLISVVLASITDSFGVFDSHFSASLDSPGAQDRASQARCAALGLQGDLISLVRTDSTAGVLESFLRDGISLEHDAVPRAYRQDIRGHPVELPVRNLDEIEPKFFQSHVKGGRQKPRMDGSQILVDEADQRHQMEASLRSLVVRERDGFHLDPGSLEEFCKPKESLRVRPKTLAHRKEIVSDPQEIAALGSGWGSQRSEDGHAVFVKSLRDRRLFTAPKLLAHPEDDRAAIRHNHGIVDKDRIRLPLLRLVVIPDLGAGRPDQGDKRVMLSSRGLEVRYCGVTPGFRFRSGERIVRSSDEDDSQAFDHALTPEGRGHEDPDPEELGALLPFSMDGWLAVRDPVVVKKPFAVPRERFRSRTTAVK